MRELSLGGFLDRYLRELSGFERFDLSKMALLADSEMPRIKEPLVVYAAMKRPDNTVRKLFESTSLLADYERYFCFNSDYSDDFFNQLPDNYKKLYRSYVSVKNQKQTEQELKDLYRKKILEIRSSSSVSDYRICKELNINSGNFHSFIYQGKTANISLEKIRKVYEIILQNCK